MSDALPFRLPQPSIRQTPRHLTGARGDSVDLSQAAIDPEHVARIAQEIQFEAAARGDRISTTEAVQRAMKRLHR